MLRKINKRIARKLFAEGKPFIIVGDNVNTSHIISGQYWGAHVDPQWYKDNAANVGRTELAFDDMVRNFEYYLEPELGRRSAFYV